MKIIRGKFRENVSLPLVERLFGTEMVRRPITRRKRLISKDYSNMKKITQAMLKDSETD